MGRVQENVGKGSRKCGWSVEVMYEWMPIKAPDGWSGENVECV